MDIENMSEKDFRESQPPQCNTMEELTELISKLEARQHDYGTCVYAVAWAALAAFNYMARQLGITGFQASCADLTILKHTRGLTKGFRILDYSKLFYPQYYNNPTEFPDAQTLLLGIKDREQIAKDILSNGGDFHPNVKQHLEAIAAGKIP